MPDPKSPALQPALGVEFTLNEPARSVPGGVTRASTRLSGERPGPVTRRLRLNRLLLLHDPQDVERAVQQVAPDDLPVLRIMAQETAVSGNEPAARHQAIYMLGRFPTVENLDALFELSLSREGAHVRNAARNALAATGLAAALPSLKEGFAAKDPVEMRATEIAVERLVRSVGVERARSLLLTGERRAAVTRAVGAVLDRVTAPSRPAVRRRGRSAEDRGRSG